METYEEKFNSETTNEDLVTTFLQWKKDAQSYHDEMLKQQKICESYYVGDQTNRFLVPAHSSNTVVNRIFEGIETLVPLTTASAHQFLATPGSEQETSLKRAENTQKVLASHYRTLNVQEKLEEVTRHMLLYRFGVLKWHWDIKKDDVGVKVIDPRAMLIPKLRLDPHELPYVMEVQDYTKDEMEDFFPDAEIDDLVAEQSSIDVGDNKNYRKNTYRVFEVWTDELTVWFNGDQVLDKKANPYYDFEGEEVPKKRLKLDKKKKEFKEVTEKELRFFNHLDSPQKPFVFFTTFRVGSEPVGSASLAEIAIPLQDDINVQKRQVVDNLRRMGNGQVYVDSDAMTEEEAGNITDEVGLIIRGEGVASENKVRREQGIALPNSHFANLQHSEATFDNIMGVHGVTRGQASQKTLGQDILSRQQDFSRADTITRVLNRGVGRLANGLVQLMKMFYTEQHVVKIIGEDGAVEFVRLNRNDIEDYIEIHVKSGNNVQLDEIGLHNEAIQLWQLNALDPVTLYERLKFANPDKAAEKLQLWRQGQLAQETQAKIQIAREGAAAKLGTSGEAAGRGVETPMNVLQRSTAGLGGMAPIAPGTPNL